MNRLFIRETFGGFEAGLDGKVLLAHSRDKPFIRAGSGKGTFEMYRGNFRISDRLDEALEALEFSLVSRSDESAMLRFKGKGIPGLTVRLAREGDRLIATFSLADAEADKLPIRETENRARPNRFRISLPAKGSEHIYGCGEQFSHFDLKGRNFPLWTSEQGVGRNKLTEITRLADADGGSGGDYYWTFFPQTSFVSSEGYWCGLDTTAYAEFDFRNPERSELYSWELPAKLVIGTAGSMPGLVSDLSSYYGRQGSLPSWCHDGVILGIQGGTATCLEKLARAEAAGVKVAGIWAQDWQGINITSFGQRLRWNWEWDPERYPGLDAEIRTLRRRGIRFLGYINPYVGAGMSLFREATEGGYLARNGAGTDYLVDFGEFDAGIVDFTNPEAFEWYKGIIRKNLIEFGLAGWMADFGEYLPTDAVLYNGKSAELAHNKWPALWARCNREAVDEAERDGLVPEEDIVYFMRAGSAGSGCGSGSQRYCPLMWAGDQNVDWSEDDGLPSVIPAALSLGMSGHGLHHSDMGGYTTLYGMKRSKELFMRWAELATFTAMMRGHEGNRPAENWQFDSDDETLSHLAAMSAFHVAMKPYFKALEKENSEIGLPLMRPLFFHHEEDEKSWLLKDEYLLGEDLLVAPVLEEGATYRNVHLPPGVWTHLWSGRSHVIEGGAGESRRNILVEAPLGQPPLFLRGGSRWETLFQTAVRAARSRYSRP